MKPTLIIAVIASLGAGFLIGKSQVPNPEIKIKEVEVIKEKKVIETLNCSGEERDSLAQAFSLLLASIGLKGIQIDKNNIQEVLKDPESFLSENMVREKLREQYLEANECVELEKNEINKASKGKFISKEQNLTLSPYPIFSNPKVAYSDTKLLNKFSQLDEFNGRFEGSLKMMKGKHQGKVFRVNFESIFKEGEKDTLGTAEYKIMIRDEKDKSWYSTNGEGGNAAFSVMEDKSITVKVMEGTYFHLTKKENVMFGNFYFKGDFMGPVNLEKVF